MGQTRHIALIGGGPASLYLYKRIVESKRTDIRVSIFEKNDKLGAGLPYSASGANPEHVTNVSGNEIPELHDSMHDWLESRSDTLLKRFDMDPAKLSDFRVLPRLLFGKYLSDQFEMFLKDGHEYGLETKIHVNTAVKDIAKKEVSGFSIHTTKGNFEADEVVICTGHNWPKPENLPERYFDSPYPPSKLLIRTNHAVGIKGASLTAIDAIRTLARFNGKFIEKEGKLFYETDPESPQFKLMLHSRNGLLPAVRFHLDDPHLFRQSVLSGEAITLHREANNGFISLDYIFDKNYKALFIEKDPAFYSWIKDLSLEDFVEKMMAYREDKDPFELLREEYREAEESIESHESILWKEQLAVLSYTLNPPAKYFSAEDFLRLKEVLMPLISIVIAFIPQSSCREIIALHDAGILELKAVGRDSEMYPNPSGGAVVKIRSTNATNSETHFKTFVDCTGQPHLQFEAFPFKSLRNSGLLHPATLSFSSVEDAIQFRHDHQNEIIYSEGNTMLRVPGIAINDHFQPVDLFRAFVPNLYIMAVPYIGGYNPDYSGLDFCEAASEKIAEVLLA